jgi:hypothetical protein
VWAMRVRCVRSYRSTCKCEFVFFSPRHGKRDIASSFHIHLGYNFFILPGEASERGIIFCNHKVLSIHQQRELDPASMASHGVPAADWATLPNDHNVSIVYFVGPAAALRLLRLVFHILVFFSASPSTYMLATVALPWLIASNPAGP